MKTRQRFDAQKAVEAILYVTEHSPQNDIYTVLKVLYFADKKHLAEYGRLVTGDSHVAMRRGPVPSGAYDIVKYVRGDGRFFECEPAAEAFAVDGHVIVPLREPNSDFLSESDIECLRESIGQYGGLSFDELEAVSHRELAYQESDLNDFISLEQFVDALPNAEDVREYLQG